MSTSTEEEHTLKNKNNKNNQNNQNETKIEANKKIKKKKSSQRCCICQKKIGLMKCEWVKCIIAT